MSNLAYIWKNGKEVRLADENRYFDCAAYANTRLNESLPFIPTERVKIKNRGYRNAERKYKKDMFTGIIKEHHINIVRAFKHLNKYSRNELAFALELSNTNISSIQNRLAIARYNSPFEVTDRFNYTYVDDRLLEIWMDENKTMIEEVEAKISQYVPKSKAKKVS